jgi:hypothetical protein
MGTTGDIIATREIPEYQQFVIDRSRVRIPSLALLIVRYLYI